MNTDGYRYEAEPLKVCARCATSRPRPSFSSSSSIGFIGVFHGFTQLGFWLRWVRISDFGLPSAFDLRPSDFLS
jgi:hypothetical protein